MNIEKITKINFTEEEINAIEIVDGLIDHLCCKRPNGCQGCFFTDICDNIADDNTLAESVVGTALLKMLDEEERI